MPSAREMRTRIRSVGNIAQMTRALQAVSASKVRRAQQAALATRPYAAKALEVLNHLSSQAGRDTLHPLLTDRQEIRQVLMVLIAGDRGLAGAFNGNILRVASEYASRAPAPVRYIVVGRKGREVLMRRRADVLAEFGHLPTAFTYADVSPIGRLAVDEFLAGRADQVVLATTRFVNLLQQVPEVRPLLPLKLEGEAADGPVRAYSYEPSESELIARIVPRFTALQVFQAVLESLASEHAARMVAMRNATDNANELVDALRLQYNKARQQAITSDMLDIVGGAEALAQAAG